MDYFFSKSTIKFRRIFLLPISLLYTGTFISLLVILLGWYFFIFQTISATHSYYFNQLPSLKKTVASLEQKKTENAKIDQTLTTLKNEREASIKQVPSFDERMQKVFDLINSSNVFLTSYMPAKEINKKWYSKRAVNYTIKGTFEHIVSFFENLTKSGLCIQCKQLMINKIEDGLLQATAILDFIEIKKSD